MVNFEEFKKIELKVAKIISAEEVEGSEKLLKLKVSLGDEERQILAGIAKKYSSQDLEGKEIILVANLEPRNLMGLESQGMLLAADDEGGPVLIQPEKNVPPGTKIR
jgi:methionine--tRNA ligase beta chain